MRSNASHVFLRNVPLSISGKYSCEVSADAPSFHTSIISAEMDVVELPTQRPIITGIHSRYRLGDVVNGNCSSDYSRPAANLTWWINDVKVLPNYVRTYEIQKHVGEQLESSVLEINFIVTLQHFIKGRLKLKCTAHIHNIYLQESEKLIEEDRPRIMASGRSPDMDMYPFDGHTNGFDDQSDIYLTHYQNLPSAAAATKDFKLHTDYVWLMIPYLISFGLCRAVISQIMLTSFMHTARMEHTTDTFSHNETSYVHKYPHSPCLSDAISRNRNESQELVIVKGSITPIR